MERVPPAKTEKMSYTIAKDFARQEIYMIVTQPSPSHDKWTARIRLPWETPTQEIEVHGSSKEEVIRLGVADLDRVLADRGGIVFLSDQKGASLIRGSRRS